MTIENKNVVKYNNNDNTDNNQTYNENLNDKTYYDDYKNRNNDYKYDYN